jgi:CHAT domain-containing protein/Tfp pilus assembly protein PilF
MLAFVLFWLPVAAAPLNGPRDTGDDRSPIQTRQNSDTAALARARALFDQASTRIDAEDLAGAEPLLREAVEIQRKLAPGSIDLARSLSALGNVIRARFDLKSAEPLLREAVAILEPQAPDSTDFAVSLNNLATLRWRQGAVDEAAGMYRRALAILERTAPAGGDAAASLMGIAITHQLPGRLAEAEPYYRRALALEERLAPGTAREARVLNNLGGLLYNRGALLEAEDLYARALTIHERVAPESQNVASTLHNIGLIHYDRGDRTRAEDYLQRALELKERLAPGGLNSASSIESLANLARDRGDLEAAIAFHRRALAIRERQAPRSLGVAATLVNLGNVAMDRGDIDAATADYEKARALLEGVAPSGLEMASLLDRLVEVAQVRKNAVEAERLAAAALTITERVAPNSAPHAFALRRVGRQASARGDAAAAATIYRQALDAVEAHSKRLGGSNEVRTAFASQRRAIYLEYLDILMTLGQPAAAFDVLERSRARGLLMMLAERDLVLDGDLSPELKQEIRELRAEDDRVQASLAKLDPQKQTAEIDRLRARQRELRETRSRIVERVRAASPRLAALQYPEPLTLDRVQQALDEGTVLLSYQIGAQASRLFVIRPSSTASQQNLAVHTIPIGEAALRDRVTAFGRLIDRQAGAAAGPAPAFVAAARGLYDLLIAPAAPAITAADRVLIVADGPLHSLPFAALAGPAQGTGDRSWQYLVEWKPLHTALSTTVYAEHQKGRRQASAPPTLVAFGDPRYPAASEGAGGTPASDVQAIRRRGYALTPLPATRAEVEALARGFGRHATVYLGEDATEARAKAISGPTYVHFATHGLLDPRSPLDSALALTMPATRRSGEENGLLQAWEIIEQVRIDADLVTLSACETALGDAVAGEGLIGLTRAFHYAGARSVLATLWQVADESTSTLMSSFYTHLRAGVPKDDALRRAQIEAISGRDTAAPFHWAAFTLSGDWR